MTLSEDKQREIQDKAPSARSHEKAWRHAAKILDACLKKGMVPSDFGGFTLHEDSWRPIADAIRSAEQRRDAVWREAFAKSDLIAVLEDDPEPDEDTNPLRALLSGTAPQAPSATALSVEMQEELTKLTGALRAAADALLWAGSDLNHAWAQQRSPNEQAATDAYAAEDAARAALTSAASAPTAPPSPSEADRLQEIQERAAPPLSTHEREVMESWRTYFGELCDVLFPESVGKPALIGWKHVIARARAFTSDKPPAGPSQAVESPAALPEEK